MAQERKYWVKESWRFNLESMNDHLWCMIYAVEDGDDEIFGHIEFPIEVAGKTCRSVDDLYDLKDECANLRELAWGRVTGKEYGRIKEIVNYRVMARYVRCIESGMSDYMAGACFEDI